MKQPTLEASRKAKRNLIIALSLALIAGIIVATTDHSPTPQTNKSIQQQIIHNKNQQQDKNRQSLQNLYPDQ